MAIKRRTLAILGSFLLIALTLVLNSVRVHPYKSVAADSPGRMRMPTQDDYTVPFPAFRIVDNLYYVGSKESAVYLVTTSEGHILINSNVEAGVPLIQKSVESLGFKFSDIKILLISHAHWDHNGGAATIKKLTGAKYMVMEGDVPVVESGGKSDFHYGTDPDALYPPTTVDRVLRDGDEVKLGSAVLTARLTPGHTRGCTTWTMKVKDGSKTRNVVIIGSPNVNPGYKLVNNDVYPKMAQDFERTFTVLKSLPVDYFLGAHGSYFDMEKKYARVNTGATTNVFIDPEGYKNFVADREQAFRHELAKQKSEAK
jgi:metallo-beta-lactamase class B